jgi:hypothetical protein
MGNSTVQLCMYVCMYGRDGDNVLWLLQLHLTSSKSRFSPDVPAMKFASWMILTGEA